MRNQRNKSATSSASPKNEKQSGLGRVGSGRVGSGWAGSNRHRRRVTTLLSHAPPYARVHAKRMKEAGRKHTHTHTRTNKKPTIKLIFMSQPKTERWWRSTTTTTNER